MRINEIIKQKRMENSLTQEELAEYLGITAPAVNKWEKGTSYPDITLLPALAKVLGTDLNTLLSFDDEDGEAEIGEIMKELDSTLQEKDYESAFDYAMDKIESNPTNQELSFLAGTYLLSAINIAKDNMKDVYSKRIEKLFEKLAKSNSSFMQNTAKAIQIGKYIDKNEFDKAEQLIKSIPAITINKDMLTAELYIKKCEPKKAKELLQSNMVRNIAETQGILLRLIQITKDEKDRSKAQKYADTCDECAKLFDMDKNVVSQALLEIAILNEDIDTCLTVLNNLLTIDSAPSPLNESALYDHINQNTAKATPKFYKHAIISDIKQRDDTVFLKQDPRFSSICRKI